MSPGSLLRSVDDWLARQSVHCRVMPSVEQGVDNKLLLAFDADESLRAFAWTFATMCAWTAFAVCGVGAAVGVNVLIGSIPMPAKTTWAILFACIGALAACAGFVIALSVQSGRRLGIRVDDKWIELAGEFFHDATRIHGKLLLLRDDLTVDLRGPGCRLDVAGLGEINIGRAWSYSADPRPVFELLRPTRPSPACQVNRPPDDRTLRYATDRALQDFHVFRSANLIRLWIYRPDSLDRLWRGWRARWPGSAALYDTLCGGPVWDGGEAPPMLPFAELILARDELHTIYRFPRGKNSPGGAAFTRVIDRRRIVEFRPNRFDAGLWIRIAGTEADNLLLPAGPGVTEFVLRELGPHLVPADRTSLRQP